MRGLIGRALVALLIGHGLLTASSGAARAELLLYEDFKSPVLDPEKWRGSSVDSIATRFVREVRGGGLRLILDSYGGTAGDSGQAMARNNLGLQVRSPFIVGLEARVKVISASAQDCAANPEGGSSQARLIASFFNDGSSPDPAANQIGNVFGIFAVQYRNDGRRTISAQLLRSTTANGEVAEQLPGSLVTFDTTWSFNKPVMLTMLWDQAAKLVRYTAVSGRSVETRTIAYTHSDADRPAGVDVKQIRIQNFAENCTAARMHNHIDAFFDNVRVEREAL